MASVENNYKLLLSIISQMREKGHLTGIDWQRVADDLGLEQGAAANKRWHRFQKSQYLNQPADNKSQPPKTQHPKNGVKENITAGKKMRTKLSEEMVDLEIEYGATNEGVGELGDKRKYVKHDGRSKKKVEQGENFDAWEGVREEDEATMTGDNFEA